MYPQTRPFLSWNHNTWQLLCCLLLSINTSTLVGATLEVGPGRTYSTLVQAAAVAVAGDTILLYPQVYSGNQFISNLHGAPGAYIHIIGVDVEQVIFQGSSQAIHLSQVSYIQIEQISITGQTANGMNIDDGGTFDTPSHHVRIINCRFYNMAGTGNNDFLKLSGLDHFQVESCTFQSGASGGSGIDMVGCHEGTISACSFEQMGSNAIQAKGGTQFINIYRNFFKNSGQRSLNLGGSTSLEFFRPQDAPFEAADLNVYANVFIGSTAPIAYVGCVRVNVSNNTIINPGNWVIRILQETVDPARFLPCGDNQFINNIIYYGALSTHVNVGPNTDASSFTFAHNLWYRHTNPSNSAPNLPVSETNPVIGQDPLFMHFGSEDFRLSATSPAIDAGLLNSFTLDFDGQIRPQGNSMDIGAFEFPIYLSIQFLAFSARLDRQFVQLTWDTEVTDDEQEVVLERKDEQGLWKPLTNVTLTPDVSRGNWMDEFPIQGWNYYRLHFIDLSGDDHSSPIAAIYFEKKSEKLNLWPNPCEGYLNYSYPIDKYDLISIYDQQGRILGKHNPMAGVSQGFISVDFLPSGIYTLQWGTQVQKFIKL